jgi:excisionase family DNA binding protein
MGGGDALFMERMLTIREVAELLGVPTSRVYDRWRDWRLPMYRVGQQLRCDPAELREWIKTHRAN